MVDWVGGLVDWWLAGSVGGLVSIPLPLFLAFIVDLLVVVLSSGFSLRCLG